MRGGMKKGKQCQADQTPFPSLSVGVGGGGGGGEERETVPGRPNTLPKSVKLLKKNTSLTLLRVSQRQAGIADKQE